METCIACNKIQDKCDCFGPPKPKRQVHVFSEMPNQKYKKPPGEKKAGIREHGGSGYTMGCRCEVCREGRRLYMREYSAKSRQRERELKRS